MPEPYKMLARVDDFEMTSVVMDKDEFVEIGRRGSRRRKPPPGSSVAAVYFNFGLTIQMVRAITM